VQTDADPQKPLANARFEEALLFAANAHIAKRQPRKGTDFPYVSHPIRVAEILDRFGADDDVIVAAFLHDLIEDAGVNQAELTERFGARVADLVAGVTEDKDESLSWCERKKRSLEKLRREDDGDVLALVAADKLDNVRALADTLHHDGEDKTWSRFNADRSHQHWYYHCVAKLLLEKSATDTLFRTLDHETRTLFPEECRATTSSKGGR
jgi:(p)ppGpp synthase/HD superfamily hydrolase